MMPWSFAIYQVILDVTADFATWDKPDKVNVNIALLLATQREWKQATNIT